MPSPTDRCLCKQQCRTRQSPASQFKPIRALAKRGFSRLNTLLVLPAGTAAPEDGSTAQTGRNARGAIRHEDRKGHRVHDAQRRAHPTLRRHDEIRLPRVGAGAAK
jgi:hypothetical protein